MNNRLIAITLGLATAAAAPVATHAQATSTLVVSENFTGTTTTNTWYYIGGACLTAGTTTGGPSSPGPGLVPACRIGSTNYAYYSGVTLDGGDTGLLPDTPPSSGGAGGALRLTNDSGNEAGAIISNFSFPLSSEGLSVTFTTETYGGDSGGTGNDGADGISFFLQDASITTPTLGDFGGSLGYTCSNVNNSAAQGYDGMVGAYLGLGIDEYGNFLNGTWNSGNSTYNSGADNTSSGYGYVWNRVGLRGAGSTAWSALNSNPATSSYYPSGLTSAQQLVAVQQACRSGIAWDYSGVTASTVANSGHNTNVTLNGTTESFNNPYSAVPVPSVTLPNYGVIPNAYKVLSSQIANESATKRGYATSGTSGSSYGIPITYQLTITNQGLLSLSYSYNGGAFSQVLTGQSILASNGALPAQVRFGFAGSTGGSNNIHEIMCFQAAPPTSAATSAGINLKQTAKVQTGTQVYFAFYNSNNWTGSLTSQYLVGSGNSLSISPTVNWDASCVLTGVATGATCPTSGATGPVNAESPSSRVMLSWSGTAGEPFEAPTPGPGITTSQLNALNTIGGPYSATNDVLNYLRGVRTYENTSYGGGEFRARTSVLADIIDSSPTWVGPPQEGLPATWVDNLHTSLTPAENSGPTYAAYGGTGTGGQGLRMNLVYSGANDGFMHAYRTGSFDSTGTFITTTYPNDGQEMLAYMPAYSLNLINSSSTDVANDFPNIQYGHQYNVDGTPGTGDLYYQGAWHTWLVGGLGAGGNAIYALDITDPTRFSEANASSLVIGEWSTTGATSTFSCVGNSTCGANLGNTYGVPQIRRLHSGQWAVIFGNGFHSSTGDAGIFIILLPSTGTVNTTTVSMYYLSTGVGSSSSPNGIAYVTPADLDGDHITDYVYAGDLQGNLWRFDLTSSTPSTWTSTTPYKVYTTGTGSAGTGLPIASKVVVAAIAGTGNGNPRVLIEFGTGVHVPITNSAADTYSTAQQYLFGIWDWNLSAWNALGSTQYDALPSGTAAVPGFASSSGPAQLQAQSILASYDSSLNASSATSTSATAYSYRTVSSNTLCWADVSGCSTTPQYGWYLPLSYGHANPYDANGLSTTANTGEPTIYEQVLFNPILADGTFIVNTTIPPTSSLATCASTSAGGWTMALNPATGGAFTNSYFADSNGKFLNINNTAVSGIALNGTGSPDVVAQGTSTYIVTQTTSGTGAIEQINPPSSMIGSRLTWIQRR